MTFAESVPPEGWALPRTFPRPEALERAVDVLPGVGPVVKQKLERLGLRTVADLLQRLGNIPAERVWFRPIPGTATEQDVIDIEARENRLCELVDGVYEARDDRVLDNQSPAPVERDSVIVAEHDPVHGQSSQNDLVCRRRADVHSDGAGDEGHHAGRRVHRQRFRDRGPSISTVIQNDDLAVDRAGRDRAL